MVPQLMEHYDISAVSFSHLSAFYYYIYTPMQLFVGVLMDIYGPRWLLTMAASCCALGTYFFVSTHSLAIAEMGRFLVGFGSAFAFVGVMKLATIWLPPSRFALVAGLASAMGMMGGAFTDIVFADLMRSNGWQHANMEMAAFGLAMAVLIFIFVRDHRPSGQYHADEEHASLAEVLNGLKSLIANPQIWINGAIGCFMWLPIAIFAEVYGIPFLIYCLHLTEQQAHYAATMIFVGEIIGAPLMGYFSDRIHRRKLPLILGSSASLICVLILLYVPNITYFEVSAVLLFFGFFLSAQPLVFAIARENCDQTVAGTAISLTNLLVMISGIMQPLAGYLLVKGELMTGSSMVDFSKLADYSCFAYHVSLAILPLFIFITMILATFFLKETFIESADDA